MENILMVVICLFLVIAIILAILLRKKPDNELPELQTKLSAVHLILSKLEGNLKEDFKVNREENTANAKDNRTELNNTLKDFKAELLETLRITTDRNNIALADIDRTIADKIDSLITKVAETNKANRDDQTASLRDFTLEQRSKFDELKHEQKELTRQTVEQLEKTTGKVEEKLSALNEQSRRDSEVIREALINAFNGFQITFDKNVSSFNELQKEKFGLMEIRQKELIHHTEAKLDTIRATVEEKLEKTLSERLGQSFETVGKHLIEVQKGLGEMQTLAQDVGGLKRVLSNVKMRGGFGEVQLHMLLESILSPVQFEANVATKTGSKERVEYAVKFPNKEGVREFV